MNRRVKATIERLISNIPAARKVLEEEGYTSLAGQLQRDCDALVYWQGSGYWQRLEESLKEILDEEALIYHQALRKWGTDLQCVILFEEMAELQKEMCKTFRQTIRETDQLDRLAEEIADVLIMLGQVMVAFDLPGAVAHFKEQKITRLKERLEQ